MKSENAKDALNRRGEGNKETKEREMVMIKKSKSRLIGMGLMMAGFLTSAQSSASLIAYEGFDAAVTGDANNGIYQGGGDLNAAPNNAVQGGDIIGFSSTKTWVTASDLYDVTLTGAGSGGSGHVGLTPTGSITLSRLFDESTSSKTEVYMSARIRMNINDTAGSAASGYVGFTTPTGTTSSGCRFGLKYNLAAGQWDLYALYNNGAVQTVLVQANMGAADTGSILVVTRMNQTTDEFEVWVNPTSLESSSAALFTDFTGRVNNMTAFYSVAASLISNSETGEGFYFDEMKLGDSMIDVVPEPTTLSLMGLSLMGLLVCRRFVK